MVLVPIKESLEENYQFVDNPDCKETIFMCLDFYKRIGYQPPWICYYVFDKGELVGSAAFKGAPINAQVEIAYGTLERFRQRGVGTMTCGLLTALALKTDPSVTVTARTLPEKNYSTRILEKNNFIFLGTVEDLEDGEVWEWKYNHFSG